ncbi:Toh1 protein [Saccharomycopsis crataegensis]|uniref:glucan endo-1,3-beta-D-glucosidase n=1 Tax=Saccharomycopsis crataegensis TaxID=43959 RepID=A0AAV5QMK3_9ASCO|nr:Toh1 protein [Saccharomycopsis crataegensis]
MLTTTLLSTISLVCLQVLADFNGQQPAASQSQASAQSSSSSTSQQYSSQFDVLEFANYGYTGYYQQVKSISNMYKDSCTCELSSDWVEFSGPTSPLDQGVSVHFRGPLILESFAYYVSDDYTYGDSSSSEWKRLSYFDASSQTSDNVTFLTKAGDNSTCLGKALTYADSDGVSSASSSTLLANNTLINSDEEYVIFSNVSCGKSGINNDCGVYRSDNVAYHGFYGDIKMFLFSFQMPTESVVTDTSTDYYDLPAIWLLNDHIPRTSQYPTNSNCSCWTSGCGEFDIFESINYTERNHLYSTIHDYQGTGYIDYGISVDGYIERDTESTMSGGVVFDSQGNAIVFISNSTSFDAEISADDVNSWISSEDTETTKTLTSVSNTKPASSGMSSTDGFLNKYFMFAMQSLCGVLLCLF